MLYGSFFMSELFFKTITAIKQNLVYFFICCGLFVLCVCCGGYFAKNSEKVLLSDSACGFLEIVFTPSASVWKYVFSKFIGGAGILIIVTLCGITIWLVPVHILLVGYFAFVSGVIAVAFYDALSVIGLCFYILIIFPSAVIRAAAIVLLSVNLISYYKEREKLKCEGERGALEFSKLLVFFAVSLVVYLIAVLFEATFLIVIIRPINIYF